ncbi:MAG: hypothetical protein NTW04_03435 [Elusimicrobia bacterium]|nr:hypothetical protein [Elusimicrobiota bacterium]
MKAVETLANFLRSLQSAIKRAMENPPKALGILCYLVAPFLPFAPQYRIYKVLGQDFVYTIVTKLIFDIFIALGASFILHFWLGQEKGAKGFWGIFVLLGFAELFAVGGMYIPLKVLAAIYLVRYAYDIDWGKSALVYLTAFFATTGAAILFYMQTWGVL